MRQPEKPLPARAASDFVDLNRKILNLSAYIYSMAKSNGLNFDKAPVPCSVCGRVYRADLIKKCPGCAAESEANNFRANSVPITPNQNPQTGFGFEDLIRAQNRTTHAVRAFVRFLFIQLSGITFAVVLWNLSLATVNQQECLQYGDNCNGNAFLQFLAVVVWIVAVVWSSKAGWEELEKSAVT